MLLLSGVVGSAVVLALFARAERVVRQAAELAAAKAEAARLWPQVEVAALAVSETADAVLSYAAVEDEEDHGALEWKLRELHAHVARLEDLALGFRRAPCQVLSEPALPEGSPLVPRPGGAARRRGLELTLAPSWHQGVPGTACSLSSGWRGDQLNCRSPAGRDEA